MKPNLEYLSGLMLVAAGLYFVIGIIVMVIFRPRNLDKFLKTCGLVIVSLSLLSVIRSGNWEFYILAFVPAQVIALGLAYLIWRISLGRRVQNEKG